MDPYALGLDGLTDLLAGEPAYRARQVHAWLVRGVDEPGEMTNVPAGLREQLAGRFDPPPRVLRHTTADGGLTHKVLLEFGAAARSEAVESVLMLYPPTARASARATVCVSAQAGCAMGCPFCATGQVGFRRQLGIGEVVRQVTVMQRLLGTVGLPGAPALPDVDGLPDHVTNVVFMGMGEPLANTEVTVAAVRWLHDPDGFNLSARSITVSTVGIVPGIRRLTELALPLTLAVSLHAPNDSLRDDLVPPNRQWPLAVLLDACRAFQERTGRRLTFEYVLIAGVNDRREHAEQLTELVASFGAHVNLIPMNATPAVPWRAPPVIEQRAFAATLERGGVSTTIRYNRGGDIAAACGQLYADYALGSGATLPAAVGAAERVGTGRRDPQAAQR